MTLARGAREVKRKVKMTDLMGVTEPHRGTWAKEMGTDYLQFTVGLHLEDHRVGMACVHVSAVGNGRRCL
jgi:hypothetical protein